MKQVIAKAQNVMVEREFNGMTFKFREDGYFNAGQAAKHFRKDLENFKRLPSTKAYITALQDSLVITTDLTLIEVIPGNRYIPDRGTWVHPKLAVFFARWLDPKFGVFCDMVIDDLMHGNSVLTVVAPEKAVAPKLPQTYLESLQELIESVKEQERLKAETQRLEGVVKQKDAKLIEQAPKVEYVEKYIEDAGSLGIRAASKVLQCNERELGHWLVDQKLAYRNPARSLVPYATAENRGLLRLTTGLKSGTDGVYTQLRITNKGMTFLRENLPAYVYKTYN